MIYTQCQTKSHLQKTVRKQVRADQLQEVLGGACAGGVHAVTGDGRAQLPLVSHHVLQSLTWDVERAVRDTESKEGTGFYMAFLGYEVQVWDQHREETGTKSLASSWASEHRLQHRAVSGPVSCEC